MQCISPKWGFTKGVWLKNVENEQTKTGPDNDCPLSGLMFELHKSRNSLNCKPLPSFLPGLPESGSRLGRGDIENAVKCATMWKPLDLPWHQGK
jgi:hypothetical protein